MVELETVHRHGDHVVVRLRGELAGRLWTENIREYLEEHYVDDGVRVVRLDLSQVTFLDNLGVATLVALLKHSQERGKRFMIEAVTGQVREKLQVTGLLRILGEAN
jgi:anti-anti-sigma factor